MKPTHLFLDISNSWVKWVAGTVHELSEPQRVLASKLTATFVRGLRRKYPNARWGVCSVVPEKSRLIARELSRGKVHFISSQSNLGIGIKYPNPQTIGADRLANAVAAAYIYPTPAVVIDFGTAVTFDVISARNAYIGGVIAPGISAMTDYLHERTALLPKLKLQMPSCAIGKSTMQAMQIGTVIGYRGLVKEILQNVKQELRAKKITVIATGGYADLIVKGVPGIDYVHPLLTLEGVRMITARHESDRRHI
jgi:type III pantothenate kinase